ncbi:MAG: sigma-54-dependent Fis family transcriptional regulator [Deltaproteobacteria bacterium]|nr:sigma-54-dependent Fis family transcriptional regulator [Deltaproteobacteria bacterium]
MMEKKILIVDDEFNSRTLLAQLFQEDGYSADTAENGKTALEALKSTPFDILITDIRMPVMDGIELFHRAKEMYPHMPVILFTAYGTIEAAVKALKEGVFHYLEKPVNFDLLNHTVQQALEIQDLEKEIINLRKQLDEKKTDQP